MKTQISHQGMSYTRSFPELAEITFIAVAEHSDNAFLTLCTRRTCKPCTGQVMEQDNTLSLNSNRANAEMANNKPM